MPVLGEIVAAPLLALVAAVVAAHDQTHGPTAACRTGVPVIRLESANLAVRHAPDSAACKALAAGGPQSKPPEKEPAKTGRDP